MRTLVAFFAMSSLVACSTPEPVTDAGLDGSPSVDAPVIDTGAEVGLDVTALDALDALDAGAGCTVSGAPGTCITVSACAALADHSPYAGHCPGPADIECCIVTPSTANNPPTPAGYHLMAQSQVTPDMTTWAVAVLDDPSTYPMFAVTTRVFGTLTVLARVEWHPPDFQNGVIHRGVTLYVPN